MPAILGPGSVSLETCAETRKLELQNLFPRRGSFLENKRPAFEKAVDPSSAGANQSQGGRLHAI